MDLQRYHFDKYLNKHLEKTMFLFKHIHPNAITIAGILINCFIINYYYCLKLKGITAILLIIRIVCDNLDGMVAREFNKTSKFGGLLDSLADCFLLMTIWYGVFSYFVGAEYSLCISVIFGCGMLWYLMIQDALFIHKNFEKDKGLINQIPILISQNTYISILFVIFIMYLVKN